ncbi:MAG: M56 family metallopeptidase [Longimicrobiaceae bacterium]
MMELIFVASALSDGAWLDALLRAALRGSVLLLAAGAAALLLRRASAAARHLVWALAFAGLLALPLLPALLPALEVPLPRAARALAAALDAWGLETPEFPEVEVPFTVEVAADPDSDPWPDPDPNLDASGEAAVVARAAAGEAVAEAAWAEENAVAGVHHGAFALGWPLVLLGVWAAGAALGLGSLLVGVLRTHGQAGRARWEMDGPLAELLERLRAEAGVRRSVLLLRGGEADMPVTWGLLRPRILLPAGAEAWPAARLRAVLLHELAHVRRGDWAVLLAVETARALYWFNPLVWAAAARLRAESEHACDDQVLRAGSRPSDYAGHLLEVARTLRAPRAAHAAAVAMARPAQIRVRLLAVLAEERPRGPVSRRFAVPVLLAASLAVGLLAALSPVSLGEAAPPEPVPAGRAAPANPGTPAEPGDPVPTAVALPGSAAPLDGSAASAETSIPSATPERCPVTSSSSHHEEVGSDGRRTATWHNQRGCGGRLEAFRRVNYTEDHTDVAQLGRGGRFMIELYDAADRRRMEMVRVGDGVLRSFTVNGRAHPWDAEARRWLAGALAEYFQASEPVSSTAAARSSGDRTAELVAALGSGAADEEILRRTVVEARSLESSGDRAAVLKAVAAHAGGSQPVLHEVILNTLVLQSSGDRVGVLLELMERHPLSTENRLFLLNSLGGIESGGDRSRVLHAFLERFGIGNAAARDAWFKALEEIPSGGDRRELLLAVVRRPEVELSRTRLVIHAAREIASSSDRAAVLLALADRGLVTEAVSEDFIVAAAEISSSTERERVLARRPRGGSAAPATAAADTLPRTRSSTTALSWSDTESGRRATLEAQGVDADEGGVIRVRPGGFLVLDESHGGFRQRVRVEAGPDGRLRRSYAGGSVEPARRLEWEAELISRFTVPRGARW